MFENTNAKENQMTTYRFAGMPSNAAVDAGVTLLTSAWLLLAAAAIIVTEGPSTPAPGPAAATQPVATWTPQAEPSVAIAPDAREVIVVEARRA